MRTAYRDLVFAARRVLQSGRRKGLKLATAESCTGGLIAALLTEVPGSSDVVESGFVTYSNQAKVEFLRVPSKMIARYGAVSENVARAMASGCLRASHADIAIAVTGIAGPGGATPNKPVGLVHLCCARRGRRALHRRRVFRGNRAAVRRQAAALAFSMISAQFRR